MDKMNAEQFDRWLLAKGWSDVEAAERFGVNPSTIWRMRTAKTVIQPWAKRMCELFDEQEKYSPNFDKKSCVTQEKC